VDQEMDSKNGHDKNGRFAKGHKKVPGSGMKAGMSYYDTATRRSIRKLLTEVMSEETQRKRWLGFLDHKSPELRWAAFKLAMFYLYGRPAKSPLNSEDMPTGQVPDWDFSAIPMRNGPIQ
jgi:hypothetical protein